MINNLEKFYNSSEEVIKFFRDHIGMLPDANHNAKQNETEAKGSEIFTP